MTPASYAPRAPPPDSTRATRGRSPRLRGRVGALIRSFTVCLSRFCARSFLTHAPFAEIGALGYGRTGRSTPPDDARRGDPQREPGSDPTAGALPAGRLVAGEIAGLLGDARLSGGDRQPGRADDRLLPERRFVVAAQAHPPRHHRRSALLRVALGDHAGDHPRFSPAAVLESLPLRRACPLSGSAGAVSGSAAA